MSREACKQALNDHLNNTFSKENGGKKSLTFYQEQLLHELQHYGLSVITTVDIAVVGR